MSFIPFDFPREVLELPSNGEKGWRRLVRSSEELQSYWKGKNGSGNVYMTAYGYNKTTAPKHHRVDYNTPLIHHFVMDFDCKDFKTKGATVSFDKPHEEVKRLHRLLMERDVLHYIWFSGGGFHVWVKLDRTLEPNTGTELSRIKYTGRQIINEWEKEVGVLRCNDPTVAFDTSGMIRIPNSFNAKRDCWSVPLTSDEVLNITYDDLLNKAMEPHTGYHALGNTPLVFEVKESFMSQMMNLEPVSLPTVALDTIHVLPCLAQAAMGEGNPTHRERYHFATYLADRLRMFYPHWRIDETEKEDHIRTICAFISHQGWADYDPEKTEEQVRSIVSTGYSSATCATLYQEGYCVGKCMYYDGTGGI